MKRAEFIKILSGACVAGIVAPATLLPTDPDLPIYGPSPVQEILIHYDTRVIEITGPQEGVSMRDLYNYLKDLWRQDEEARKYGFPFSHQGGWGLKGDSDNIISLGVINHDRDNQI